MHKKAKRVFMCRIVREKSAPEFDNDYHLHLKIIIIKYDDSVTI